MFVLSPNSAFATLSTTRSPVQNSSYVLVTTGTVAANIYTWKANTNNLVGSMVVSPNSMVVLLKQENDTVNAIPSVSVSAVKVRM